MIYDRQVRYCFVFVPCSISIQGGFCFLVNPCSKCSRNAISLHNGGTWINSRPLFGGGGLNGLDVCMCSGELSIFSPNNAIWPGVGERLPRFFAGGSSPERKLQKVHDHYGHKEVRRRSAYVPTRDSQSGGIDGLREIPFVPDGSLLKWSRRQHTHEFRHLLLFPLELSSNY